MEEKELQARIASGIQGALVSVVREGSGYQVVVVSNAFEGLSRVKKQQLVYGCFKEQVADGSIHAVTMQTFTPEEWEKNKHFYSVSFD